MPSCIVCICAHQQQIVAALSWCLSSVSQSREHAILDVMQSNCAEVRIHNQQQSDVPRSMPFFSVSSSMSEAA